VKLATSAPCSLVPPYFMSDVDRRATAVVGPV
jgi:hypothetical protein